MNSMQRKQKSCGDLVAAYGDASLKSVAVYGDRAEKSQLTLTKQSVCVKIMKIRGDFLRQFSTNLDKPFYEKHLLFKLFSSATILSLFLCILAVKMAPV